VENIHREKGNNESCPENTQHEENNCSPHSVWRLSIPLSRPSGPVTSTRQRVTSNAMIVKRII
jgi:hypothetical protein